MELGQEMGRRVGVGGGWMEELGMVCNYIKEIDWRDPDLDPDQRKVDSPRKWEYGKQVMNRG